MKQNLELNPKQKQNKNQNKILKDFLRSFLMPTLIGKSFVLYFGLKFSESNDPDTNYGWGLVIALIFTFSSLVLFAWKYRNTEDL